MAKKRKDASEQPNLFAPPKKNAGDESGEVNWLSVLGAAHNNLKSIDVHFPLARFIAVTGVSGSGKSSLVNDILREALARDLNGAESIPGKHDRIVGLEHLDKIIDIDQSPIGRTPRSNPATYIKVFDRIRTLLCELPLAKARGFAPGRFSFNVEGGRCEACEGNGSNKLEMDFLADVWVTCPVCEGRRFNRQTLDVRFKDRNIHDILEMDVQEAVEHFREIGPIHAMLKTLHDVGLDYIKLGQPSPTLSGGEAQRIKLARELCKRSTGRTLYVLDEPTTGLHFEDIRKLLDVLHGFVEAGNTVLVIEHNLDVIRTADWIIDLGPEGGGGGGRIVTTGTPEQVAECAASFTGQALRAQFQIMQQLANPSKRSAKESTKRADKPAKDRSKPYEFLEVEGARQHNLKDVSAKVPLHQMTVFSGPSGSGKSSLAIDTLYAEGHRRYVESLSSYARQFLGQMQKPVVEKISGLPPAISIEQKAPSKSPRSTVGTVTEIYDYFRILFARLGKPHCPKCQIPIGTQTSEEIIDKLLLLPDGTKLYLMAPIKLDHNQDYPSLWKELEQSGFVRMRVDNVTYEIGSPPEIDKRRKHLVEVIVDRLVIRANQRPRIAESVEAALAKGRGVIHIAFPDPDVAEKKWQVDRYSQHLACDRCGRSFVELTPNHFSFNSPIGWCPQCEGLGTQVGGGVGEMESWQTFSIRNGSISLMTDLQNPENPLVGFMTAVAKHVGFSLDSNLKDISAEKKRAIFHGTGEEWIPLDDSYGTKFQYKGIYPAITEASRLSWVYRNKVSELVGETACSACQGSRLRDDSAASRFSDRTISQWCGLPLEETLAEIKRLELTKTEKQIAGELIREICNRLEFLVDVGLEYLTLARSTPTLSGGEAQRIRLASQLGSGLTGVLYLLDEPTIGLHPRDTSRLLRALQKLRNLGNTLVLVEHDAEVIASADSLLDFGPGAGRFGGNIVAQGAPAQVIKKGQSLTGQYLGGTVAIPIPTNRRPTTGLSIQIEGANHHNLKDLNVSFPLGCFTAVTGVSGSGKSSLITDILWASLAKRLHRSQAPVGLHAGMTGIEAIDKVINVDQQAIGNTPASNPATYTGVFDLIREVFAQLPDAKVRGYSAGRFSFNKPGGRCEACEGNGQKKIEMHFLPDVWIECDVCKGHRYTPETLAVQFKGKSIAEVLELSVTDALALFANVPRIRRLLQMLDDVGLGYMALGQSAPTLSGGEAQRVKLAAELARPNTGKTLYILDEPTTGLHFDDIRKLLLVLHRLVDLGNTVVVIEHNLDVMKTADWIIDVGPEAGEGGGQIVFAGTPEQMAEFAERQAAANGAKTGKGEARGNKSPGVAKSEKHANSSAALTSHTARCLLPVMKRGPFEEREVFDSKKAAAEERRKDDLDIDEVGRDVKMPWELDGPRWHIKDRVSRVGRPVQWEGAALKWVVQQIESYGMFSATNWNNRSLVEISAARKSDGWFLHALTNEEWLLELKFRVSRGAFKTELLNRQLGLRPLNEMKEIPVYGGGPRAHVKQTKGLHGEVRLTVYRLEEIQTPAFEEFLRKAADSFVKTLKKAEDNPEKSTPWLENGLEWHTSERGFPPGRKVYWNKSIVTRLLRCIEKATPNGKWDYESRDSVKRRLPGSGMAWARLMTKLPRALELNLVGKKAQFNLAAIDQFGAGHEIKTSHAEWDSIRLSFQKDDDWSDRSLIEFLENHAAGFVEAFAKDKEK